MAVVVVDFFVVEAVVVVVVEVVVVVVVVVVSVVEVVGNSEEAVDPASFCEDSEDFGRYEGRDLIAFAQPVVKKAAAMTNAAAERSIF